MSASNDPIIHVNMTGQSVSIDPAPEEWQKLNGRGLSAKTLLRECDATCAPLDPDNVLVIAPGVLAQTESLHTHWG